MQVKLQPCNYPTGHPSLKIHGREEKANYFMDRVASIIIVLFYVYGSYTT